MEHAKTWWNNLSHKRKKYLAEYHEWTTPDKLTDNQILNIYLAEDH